MNVLKDTWYIMLRDLRTRIRMPIFIFMSLSQPILFLLLFPQIFKSIGSSGMLGSDVSYLTFFTPGVLVQTVMFSAIFSGMSMIVDMDTGILSRMLATPVTRVSIILGRVIAAVVVILIQTALMLGIAAIMGVDIAAGFGGVMLIFLLIALIGLSLAAFSNGLAILLKRQEGLMAVVNLITLPLMFLSTMMMPSKTVMGSDVVSILPHWLDVVRQFNPIDYAIVSIRDLVMGKLDLTSGTYVHTYSYIWPDLWRSLLVLGVIAVIMVAFATRMFRRRAE
jgi:ABC-2 type transport system permease protein